MKCFDSYRFENKRAGTRTLNSNKDPFRHKRILQNAMVLNKTIAVCNEPLKNHMFLECRPTLRISLSFSLLYIIRSNAWGG